MKTRELMATDEAELVSKLKAMKVKELEKHAQKILLSNGGADYNTAIGSIIKVIPTLSDDPQERYQAVQAIVKGHLNVADNDDVYEQGIVERVTAIFMVLITKKFQQIHNG